MKQLLLFFLFCFSSSFLLAQSSSSLNDRYLLAYNQDNSPTMSIQIYPNPAVNYFQISNMELGEIKKVTVINMLGKTMRVFESFGENKKFNIADLPRGMYLVQITNKGNKIIATKRVKKQ